MRVPTVNVILRVWSVDAERNPGHGPVVDLSHDCNRFRHCPRLHRNVIGRSFYSRYFANFMYSN